jgi:UDPglucose 6-dehydrogenase
MSRIVVIGNWHLAFVTAVGLAEIGHEVTMLNHEDNSWDVHRERMAARNEPGLMESINESVLKDKLSFAKLHFEVNEHNPHVSLVRAWSDIYDNLKEPVVLWLAIDTPLFADGSPNVDPLFDALTGASCGRSNTRDDQISFVVVSSQVPIGFCQRYQSISGAKVACVPENYRFGKAMSILRDPDRLVIGANDAETRQAVRNLFAPDPLTGGSRYHNVIMCDLPTAEMIKHATNAFLGMCISFANEMSRVGKAYGADVALVEKGLRADSRIGQGAPIRAGGAFTGGTLTRDLRALQRTKIDVPLVNAVLEVNERVLIEENTQLIRSST